MRLKTVWIACCVLGCATESFAQEKKIKRADLPPVVEKTVAAESAGATIKGFSMEKEKGEVFYEAEMVVDGHSKDVLINASGLVVEVEEEVALDKLPAEVKAGLEAKAGKAKIGKVESLTISGAHNCCGLCCSGIKQALKNVPGVTGNTAKPKEQSFKVTGNFDAADVVKALNKAGFAVKVEK